MPVSTNNTPSSSDLTGSHEESALAGVQERLIEARKQAMKTSGASASDKAIRAAGAVKTNDLTKIFQTMDRLAKPFALMDKQADMLNVAMGITDAKQASIGAGIRTSFTGSLDLQDKLPKAYNVASLMPDLSSKMTEGFSKSIVGLTDGDPLTIKVSGIKALQPNSAAEAPFNYGGVLPLDTGFDVKTIMGALGGAENMEKAVFSVREGLPGLHKDLLSKNFYGNEAAKVAAAASTRALGQNPPFARLAMDGALRRQIQVPKNFEMERLLQTAKRINGGPFGAFQGASALGGMTLSKSFMDQMAGSPLRIAEEFNSKLFGPPFQGVPKWATESLSESVGWGPPDYDIDEGGLWDPAEAWTTFEEYVETLLRTTSTLAQPTLAEFLSKYLYARDVIARNGISKTGMYALRVILSLCLALDATGRAITDPGVIAFLYLVASLYPLEDL